MVFSVHSTLNEIFSVKKARKNTIIKSANFRRGKYFCVSQYTLICISRTEELPNIHWSSMFLAVIYWLLNWFLVLCICLFLVPYLSQAFYIYIEISMLLNASVGSSVQTFFLNLASTNFLSHSTSRKVLASSSSSCSSCGVENSSLGTRDTLLSSNSMFSDGFCGHGMFCIVEDLGVHWVLGELTLWTALSLNMWDFMSFSSKLLTKIVSFLQKEISESSYSVCLCS